MASTCSVDGCASNVMAKRLCPKHYNRMRRKGSTDDVRKNAAQPCSIEGCEKPRSGFGRCDTHYRREFKPKAKVNNGERACGYCGEPLAPERPKGTLYCDSKCKGHARAASGAAREATRRHYLKSRYGITEQELAEMLEAQGGVCAICKTDRWGGKHNVPHVDHCHATNGLRKLLCNNCNTGLGWFADDPNLLEAAAAYLREHQLTAAVP